MNTAPPAVLLVAEGGDSGGIGRYCVDLAGAMGSRASVVCLCPGPCAAEDCWLAGRCADRGIRLEPVRMPPKAWRTGLAGLLGVWRRSGRPLLHVNGRRGNAIALIARLVAPGLHYVTTVHGVLGLHDRRNALYRLVDLAGGRGARAVIAVSRDTRRRLLAAGSSPARTHVVANALAAPEMAAFRAVAEARWQAGHVDGPLRIGFLGRLSREKGTHELVEVARALHAMGAPATMAVGGDGPDRAWMTENARPLMDMGSMTFHGEVRDAARFLSEIDVLLMPSHNEGLPYVLLEAMAAGCAVVAFDVGGISEVISDPSLGILVTPGDVVRLGVVLQRLCDERETVVALGRAAAEHVAGQFALAERLPLLSRVYGVDIVEGPGARGAGGSGRLMRIALVDLLCNSPFYCGELTRALRRAGIDAQLASPRFYLEPEFLDTVARPRWIRDLVVHASQPRALRLAVRALEGSLNFATLLMAVRARRYAVVHVQWVPFEGRASPFMTILRAWCDRAGALLVYTAHNAAPHDSERIDRRALRHDLDLAHLVVAHTEHIARQLTGDLGTRTQVVVIPHGPLFADHKLPARDQAEARFGRATGPVVLFQGLIRPYKGLDLLGEAWPAVLAAFPTAELHVVGKVADSESRGHVDRLASLDRVHIVDRYVTVPEMLDRFALADVVVFPYRGISQSGALMTAVGLGRPTVVTPIDGFREQVQGLRSAVIADDVSGPAISRALITSLERLDDLSAAAEADRTALSTSPLGWAAVAGATRQAYEVGLRAREGRG